MGAKRLLVTLFVLAILLTCPILSGHAQSNSALVQCYMNDQSMDLFVSDDLNSQSLSIKVSNQAVAITDSGLISDEKAAERTTILVDVSTSIPSASRDKIHEFIEYTIRNTTATEEMRIITFDAETKVIQDFTSDRYDLSEAAKGIKFKGKQSAVYDAIYNTIPQIQAINEMPCFYHTIVLTDGADYTAQGITKEELFMRLQTETYPIDVICVSPSAPENPDKDLAALTRISNGRYCDLYPETDIAELTSKLSVGDYFRISAEVPAELLDGSTRQVDISDGSSLISFDMKMTVIDMPNSGLFPASQDSMSTETNDKSENSELSAASGNDDKFELVLDKTTIIIITSTTLAVIIAAIIVIVAVRSKKRLELTRTATETWKYRPDDGDETEYFNDDPPSDEHYTIKISNINISGESWVIDISEDILIGRLDHCVIKINEKSVSREQCKISVKTGGLFLTNISQSNVTKLNGTRVNEGILLHPGDTISFGRVDLQVDYIQKVGAEIPLNNNHDSSGNGNTESIF